MDRRGERLERKRVGRKPHLPGRPVGEDDAGSIEKALPHHPIEEDRIAVGIA